MIPPYRVLSGLPPYGPRAVPFSATGQGLHREGLVVEFRASDGSAWVGNFQRGLTKFDVVQAFPGSSSIVVIAGGQAYVVNPDSRRCLRTFGGGIEHLFALRERLIVSNGLWLEAIAGEHMLWRSRRLSWDGMMNLCVEGSQIVGEAYDPMDDKWIPFAVDVADGQAHGGSYPVELR